MCIRDRLRRGCRTSKCVNSITLFASLLQLGDERIEGARRNLSLLYAHYRAVATPAVERWHACQFEPPVLPVTVAFLIIVAPYNVGCHEHNRLTLRSVERTLEKRYRHPRVATPWHTMAHH